MESRLRGHSGKFSRLSYKHSRVRSIPPSLLLFATSNIYTYIPYRCLSDGVSKRHAQQCRNPWAFNKRTIDNTAWRGVDWKNAALRDRDKLKPGWRFDCRPRPIYLLRSIFAPLDPLSPLSPPLPLQRYNRPFRRGSAALQTQTAISNDNPGTTNSIYPGHYPLYHTFTAQDIYNLSDG